MLNAMSNELEGERLLPVLMVSGGDAVWVV